MTISFLLIGLILVAGMQIAIDPLFQYHTPWFGLRPVITNERYQNAGIAKTFEFDNVIIGNSLSENFRVSDISKAFGGETVKLTASGSHTLDWTYILDALSKRDNQPKHILFNMDPYIFQASFTELKHEVPTYLYDDNYLNDMNYLFNFSVINDFTFDTLKKNMSNRIPDYDSFMLWDDDFEYGKDFVLDHYQRPKVTTDEPDTKGYIKTVKENLDLLLPYIERLKDTEFVFFFSPFSMLYWDMQTRENSVDMQKEGFLTACEILSEYENVAIYLWNDSAMLNIMGDLENYVDEAHYSPEICTIMAERFGRRDGIITKETYQESIDKLFSYIESYDYDSLFK